MDEKPLNVDQKQFINELFKDPDRNATGAYSRAYGNDNPTTCRSNASKLMADPRVKAEVARRLEELAKASHITATQIFTHVTELAAADPRDLVEYRRGACRYCHGEGHKYQRRPQEYRDAVAAYMKEFGKGDPFGVNFDPLGGLGFNQNKPPHPDCPECDGRGVGYTYAKDLRDLTLAQARLIRGIKETKDGLEIKTRDQDKAVDLAARLRGMTREKDPAANDDVPPAATVSYEAQDGKV